MSDLVIMEVAESIATLTLNPAGAAQSYIRS